MMFGGSGHYHPMPLPPLHQSLQSLLQQSHSPPFQQFLPPPPTFIEGLFVVVMVFFLFIGVCIDLVVGMLQIPQKIIAVMGLYQFQSSTLCPPPPKKKVNGKLCTLQF